MKVCPNQLIGINGCQNLLTDPNNCGTCNTKCSVGLTCQLGICK